MRTIQKTLFERIGGKPALDAAVELFYEKVLADDSINSYFKGVDMKGQKNKLRTFLAMVLGAPVKYTGKDLREGHRHLVERGLNDEHFNAVAGHLVAVLRELGVNESLIAEVGAIAESTRNDVLNKNSENMALGNNMQKPEKQSETNFSKTQSHMSQPQTTTGAELQDAIQQKEALTQVLEQAIDAIISINSKKEVTFMNKAAEQMFGYSRSEVIGQNVKMIVPMEHRGNHDNYVDTNMRTGHNKVVGSSRDLEATRRNGEKFWVNLSLSKVIIDGEINYTAFIKDITEKIKADKVAEDQRKRSEQTLEQVVDAVITINSDKLVTFMNKAAEQMFGYNRSEVMGQNVRMIVPMEHRGNHDNYVDTNMRTGVNKVVGSSRELEATRRDGSRFWANLSLSKVEVDGQIQYTAFIKDITTDVENRNKANSIKQAVDTGWASIEFTPDGTILDANDNFVKGLGYNSKTELVSQHHRMFCDPTYVRSAEYSMFWTDLARGNVNSGEFKRITKQGTEIWINASYTPVTDEKGKVYKVIKIANDVTEMVRNRTQAISLIEEVNKMADKVVNNGDIDVRVNAAALSGDYKALGDSLNTMLESISTPMKNVSRLSNIVASSAEELLTKGEQMKNTTQEVASATQQMSEGAQQQAQQTDESSKLVDGVLKSANDMGKKAEIINNAAERGQKSATEGLITIKKVVMNMDEILNSANVTSGSINVLTQRSEEIARTLNVITDIASQTNLLALNAAIEAARAGDAGRGFAVVAEEIRKLAEDSRKSAVDIEKVIREVQKDISSAGKSIESMESSVKSGGQASKEAELVFQNIEKSSTETLNLSKEIVDATGEQKTAIGNTVKNIEKIVVVSEETASGTEQVASSAKELSQGMSEVTSTARDLADVANQLLEGISRFKFKQ